MNEMIASAFLGVLLLSFVSAGMLEFQRDPRSLRSRVRVPPLAFAVVLSILLLIAAELHLRCLIASGEKGYRPNAAKTQI